MHQPVRRHGKLGLPCPADFWLNAVLMNGTHGLQFADAGSLGAAGPRWSMAAPTLRHRPRWPDRPATLASTKGERNGAAVGSLEPKPARKGMPAGSGGAHPLTKGIAAGALDANPLSEGMPLGSSNVNPLRQGMSTGPSEANPPPQGIAIAPRLHDPLSQGIAAGSAETNPLAEGMSARSFEANPFSQGITIGPSLRHPFSQGIGTKGLWRHPFSRGIAHLLRRSAPRSRWRTVGAFFPAVRLCCTRVGRAGGSPGSSSCLLPAAIRSVPRVRLKPGRLQPRVVAERASIPQANSRAVSLFHELP